LQMGDYVLLAEWEVSLLSSRLAHSTPKGFDLERHAKFSNFTTEERGEMRRKAQNITDNHCFYSGLSWSGIFTPLFQGWRFLSQ
jgi:hypothetical protein